MNLHKLSELIFYERIYLCVKLFEKRIFVKLNLFELVFPKISPNKFKQNEIPTHAYQYNEYIMKSRNYVMGRGRKKRNQVNDNWETQKGGNWREDCID